MESRSRATRTGRKRYMLSGSVENDHLEAEVASKTSVVTCRLFQRGPGWRPDKSGLWCTSTTAQCG